MVICEECCAAYVDSWLSSFLDSIWVLASRKKQLSWI